MPNASASLSSRSFLQVSLTPRTGRDWEVRAGGSGLGGTLLTAAQAPHIVHEPELTGCGADGAGRENFLTQGPQPGFRSHQMDFHLPSENLPHFSVQSPGMLCSWVQIIFFRELQHF